MCLSYPVLVEQVHDDGTATVTDRGTRRLVPLIVLTSAGVPVRAGDWLLVHSGLAVAAVSAEEAGATLAMLETAMLENVEVDR